MKNKRKIFSRYIIIFSQIYQNYIYHSIQEIFQVFDINLT